ncbi:hypothetical protein UFOVP263_34 [uncultured Caudovirales phage]|uniref:Uncharacterized protein n=1 Tax=uncultured Caudovirales phage TaxID=2100421 RepID=A0A6J5TDH1_9CAUD|nr:hypothetical protein UFOVP263_34 [uncultured Caudovirales phage]CAB4242045.1 hypothetical protein UFOVP91_28 [uncultured Caudovirales phage]
MKAYLVARLSEASTWRGVIALLTAVGITLTPDQTSAIVSLGLALMGAVGVFTADASK